MRGVRTWIDVVVEMLPVVEPDFGKARVVVVDDAARAAGKRVRRGFAEHVAHVRARGDLQRTTTHPHLAVLVTMFNGPRSHRDTRQTSQHLKTRAIVGSFE